MSSLSSGANPEDKVQFAVELAPDAMLRLSSEGGRIIYANRAAHSMLGYAPQELTSLQIFDIAPSYSRSEWPARCQHLREVGTRVFETIYLTKEGLPVPVDVAVSHQRYDGEDFAEIIARDISAKRALEEQVLEIQDRERNRIGQDLHDDIGQRLTGIAFSLDALERDSTLDNSSRADRLRGLASYTRETLEQVRSLAVGLSPIPEHSIGLTGALGELAGSVSKTLSIDCELQCACGELVKDTFVANNAYRIAQEAIANAVKHGGAKQITMVCGQDDGQFTLSIIDDGCGMDGPPDSGLGTRTMRYRARAMGGELEIRAGDEAGTVVRLTCPIDS